MHLLKNIHRRKPAAHHQAPQGTQIAQSLGACLELGEFGLQGDVERLNRDKDVLMAEIVKLRQQEQQTEREVQIMSQRLHVSEQRQQQMVSFLARAMQNPTFLAQLLQMDEANKLLTSARKKRRLPEPDGSQDDEFLEAQGRLVRYSSAATESTHSYLPFLNAGNSASKADVPLEVLLRDLYDGSMTENLETNRQSGVVLTEIPENHIVSEELDALEIPTEPTNHPVNLSRGDLCKADGLGSSIIPDKMGSGSSS